MYGMVSRAFRSVKKSCPRPTFRRRPDGRRAPAADPELRVSVIPRQSRRDRHREEAPRRRAVEVLVVLAFAAAMILAILCHTVPM